VVQRGRGEQTVFDEPRRSSGVVVSLLILAFASLAAHHWLGKQIIESSRSEGDTRLSHSAVQAVLAQVHGAEHRSVDLADVRDSLERIPFVRSAVVYFHGVRGIEALIQERTPVAQIVQLDGSLRYVDADGMVLPATACVVPHTLPLIRPDNPQSSASVATMVRVLLTAQRELSPNLYATISELTERPGGDLLIMADHNTWRIGLPEAQRYREAFADMNVFWDRAARSGSMPRFAEVDLRWSRHIVVRRSGGEHT
jgi:cell division septal protein FtsQ